MLLLLNGMKLEPRTVSSARIYYGPTYATLHLKICGACVQVVYSSQARATHDYEVCREAIRQREEGADDE